jgi:hypothetical protein
MKSLLKAAVAASALMLASPAAAEIEYLGTFEGTDCSGSGGFPNCWATQNGVVQGPVEDPLASPTVYKIGSDGETQVNDELFPTIDGSEFSLTIEDDILSFTYDQGEGDPFLHYFTVKQGDEYALFYDEIGITSGTVDLADLFPDNVGFSHVTFFDTGGTAVPEPGTWGMMLMGFGAAGFAMRRRRRDGSKLAQVA